MAYIYTQDPNEDAVSNVSTNIFNQSTGTGQPQGDQGGAQGGAQTKATDTSDSIGSGGNASGAQAQARTSDSASSSKDVIRRNSGRANSPVDIGDLRTNMSSAKDNLQKEANNYTTNWGKSNQMYGGQEIQSALNGDDNEFNAIGQRLTQAKPTRTDFSPETKTDYTAQLNDLSDQGLRNYFKTANGPATTLGDAAFDTMLLNKNKQFKQDRAVAQQEAKSLATEASGIRDKANTDAETQYQQAWDTGTNNIKDAIGAYINPIKANAEAQAAAETRKRQELASMTAAQKVNTGGYADWLRGLGHSMSQNPGDVLALGDVINKELGGAAAGGRAVAPTDFGASFFKVGQDPVSVNNYLSADQANALNRATKLLGTGGAGYSSAGSVGNSYLFDNNAAKAWLNDQLGQVHAAQEKERQRQAEEASKTEEQRQAEALARADAARREQERKEANRNKNAVTAATGGMSDEAEQAKKVVTQAADAAGTVICTEYHRQGWISDDIYIACQQYGKTILDPETKQNYLAWARHVVPVLRAFPVLCYVLWPLFYNWFFYMAWAVGKHPKKPVFGHMIFKVICPPISNLVGSALRRSRRVSVRAV